MKYLTKGDAKTVKGEKRGYLTFILYLAPGDLSGREVCPKRTTECFDDCLYHAGRGAFPQVKAARIRKTKEYFDHKGKFLNELAHDIDKGIAQAKRLGLTPCFRLDGTSDLGLGAKLSQKWPGVQFYDYTKVPQRAKYISDNYHLTLSYSGHNEISCRKFLKYGGNVAVVFSGELPENFWGYPVVNGDENDLRFLDGSGVIVGLTAKGTLRGKENDFIQRAA